MKTRLVSAIALAILALGQAGCGDGGSATETTATAVAKHGLAMRTKGVGRPPTRVNIPPGPPPDHLVVKELKKGFGAAAHWGERLTVHFVGINDRTHKLFEINWPNPFAFNFGSGEVRIGWERGLKGMRVGGRRELIFPARLGYGPGTPPLFYIVELLAIEKR